MRREPVSFQRGMRIIGNNRYSLLSGLLTDEKLYARTPVIKRGKGPYLYDYDENRFIDFDLHGGTLLLGHAPPRLTSVMKAWLNRGFSPGFPSAAHRLLSKTLQDVLYEESNIEIKLVYLDSIYQAVPVLSLFLSQAARGGGGVFVCNRKEPHDIPLFYHNLNGSTYGDIEGLNAGSIDYAVLRIDEAVDPKMVHGGLKWLKKRSIPLIGDAATFNSFLHMKRLKDWHRQFDAVIFGSWLTSGLPFSAISLHDMSIFNKDGGSQNQILSLPAALPETGASSLYKLKTAQRSLHILQKSGGFSALLDKHGRFYAALDKKYFKLCGGLVCFCEDDRLRNAFGDLRLHLLRAGFIFPHALSSPLALSFAHSDELVKKSAHGINEILHLFFQS
jgi:hypothetical protein